MTNTEEEQLASNFSLLAEINSEDRLIRFQMIYLENKNLVDAAKTVINQDVLAGQNSKTGFFSKCSKWARSPFFLRGEAELCVVKICFSLLDFACLSLAFFAPRPPLREITMKF